MHYNILAGIYNGADLKTNIFGKTFDLPFFACPCAGQRMFNNEGEKAVAITS